MYDFNQGNRDPAVVKRQVKWAHDEGLQTTVKAQLSVGFVLRGKHIQALDLGTSWVV